MHLLLKNVSISEDLCFKFYLYSLVYKNVLIILKKCMIFQTREYHQQQRSRRFLNLIKK